MEKVLSECMKLGGDAISMENQQRNYEAYRKYLLCCYKVFLMLSTEVNSMNAENYHMRLKLAKLARDCAERVVEYCNNPDTKILGNLSRSGSCNSPTMPTRQSSIQLPRTPSEDAFKSPSRLPASQNSIPSNSSASNSMSTNEHSTDDPEILAKRRNQILLETHRKRLENMQSDPARRANLTLSLQKRMMENMEIAKRRKSVLDDRLFERQQRLKNLADRRIASLRLSDATKKKQHNDLLTTIYLHDDKYKWPLTLKGKLSEGGSINLHNTTEFCKSVLRSTTHPLAVIAQDCEKQVKDIASPLHIKYGKLITECVSVPYEYRATVLSDQAVQELELEINDNTEEPPSNNNFAEACEESADQVNLAIAKTKKTVKNLDDIATTKPSKREETDDMDSLFDSDEENFDDEPSNSEQQHTTLPRAESQLSDVQREKRVDDLEEVQSLSESMQEKLAEANKIIHQTMYTLKTLFMLAYDDMNCTEGCDIIHDVMQQHIFGVLGDELQFLYRLANLEKECRMAEVMTEYMPKDISALKVKEKWYLETQGECYNHLVRQLQTINSAFSPLQKMSCSVKVNRGVVETTAAYFQAKGENEPMGADDLLPIICYIVMKSELPQIFSQCAMMEEFIPPEYLMEEEGYSLSTFLMAVQYLLTL